MRESDRQRLKEENRNGQLLSRRDPAWGGQEALHRACAAVGEGRQWDLANFRGKIPPLKPHLSEHPFPLAPGGCSRREKGSLNQGCSAFLELSPPSRTIVHWPLEPD